MILSYSEFFDKHKTKDFYKILPECMKSYNHQYTIGKNTNLNIKLDDNEGFHFCEFKQILIWINRLYDDPKYIARIKLLKSNYVECINKYKTDEIFIEDIVLLDEFIMNNIHKLIKSSPDNAIDILITFACKYNNLLLLKFLHKELDLTMDQFRMSHNFPLHTACEKNYIDIVKYLHKEVGLKVYDFTCLGNYMLRNCCYKGYLDLVKYLYEEVGVTKQDFISFGNSALKCAYTSKNLVLIEYIKNIVDVK